MADARIKSVTIYVRKSQEDERTARGAQCSDGKRPGPARIPCPGAVLGIQHRLRGDKAHRGRDLFKVEITVRIPPRNQTRDSPQMVAW